MDSGHPCLGLDMLTKAANYIEICQERKVDKDVNSDSECLSLNEVPKTLQTASMRENGHLRADAHSMGNRADILSRDYDTLSDDGTTRASSFLTSSKVHTGERALRMNKESMRFYPLNETSSADESLPKAHDNQNNSDLLLQQRLCGGEKQSASCSRERSMESPGRSPERKPSESPVSAVENNHQQRNAILAQLSGTQPVSNVRAPNSMMRFVQPFIYPTLDPMLYFELLARQNANMNGDVHSQHSPSSSPNAVASGSSVPMQSLPNYAYPFGNSPSFMGFRGVNELPMLFPTNPTACGPATNTLPHPLSALASMSEQEKRLYESMPSFAAQHLPAQLLTNPYLKGFYPPTGFEAANGKDSAGRSLRKIGVSVPVGIGLPSVPASYTTDLFLKSQETFPNEVSKLDSALPHLGSSSPASRDFQHSDSPENKKKFSSNFVEASIANSLATSRSESPSPERNFSGPICSTKNGVIGPKQHEPCLSNHMNPNRDPAYNDNPEIQSDGDNARRQLVGLPQRSHEGSIHREHRLSPPYTEHRNFPRISRDLSPNQATIVTEASMKRRSNENYDILRDSTFNIKPRTSGAALSRASKSPLVCGNVSPVEHPSRGHQIATNFFSSLASKSGPGMSEKDAQTYLANAASPYLFHPALGGLTSSSFALPPYLRQAEVQSSSTSKAVAEALSAVSPSTIYRSPVPSEAIAEYASRLAGMTPYGITCLMPPQQQGFRHALIPQNPPTSDYSAAVQAAMQQSLFLERAEKERMANPIASSLPAITSMLPYLQASVGAHSKLAHGLPAHFKGLPKHSSPYQYLSAPPVYSSLTSTSSSHADESRSMKRETSPTLATKKPALSNSFPRHGQQSPSVTARQSDDEKQKRLKRRAEEEERYSAREVSLKRKREVISDVTAPDIEEHFRRSLGANYEESSTTNKFSISGSVDIHFQKALGSDVWSKLKPNNKSLSPELAENVSNSRENLRSNEISASPHVLPSQTMHGLYSPHHQHASEKHNFSSVIHSTNSSPRNSLPNKLIKARGMVYAGSTNESPSNLCELDLSRSREISSNDFQKNSTARFPNLMYSAHGNEKKEGIGLFTDVSTLHRVPSPARDSNSKRSKTTANPLRSASPVAAEKPLLQRPTPHNTLVTQPPPYNSLPIYSSYAESTALSPAYSPQNSASIVSTPLHPSHCVSLDVNNSSTTPLKS